MSPLQVRTATIGDAEALAATGRAAFVAAYRDSSDPGDLEKHVEEHFGVEAVRRELARDSVTYVTAVEGMHCAGLLKLRAGPVPDAVPADRALEVQQCYVAPNFQRRGVGRRLMAYAVDFARERFAEGLWLSVWSEADWATAFYRDLGFVRTGEATFMLGRTKYVDDLMWLPLAGDSAGP